jgi:hypothetical protein
MSTKAAPHHIVLIQDSGTTWVQRGSRENWVTVAASSDGSRLVAIKENYGMRGEGGIYVSVCQRPMHHDAGVAGRHIDQLLDCQRAGCFAVGCSHCEL